MNQRTKLRSEELAQRTGGRVRAAELRGRLTACGAVDSEFRPTAVAGEMGLAEPGADRRLRWIVEAVVDFALAAREAEGARAKAAAKSAPRRKPKRAPRKTLTQSGEASRIAERIRRLEEAGRDKEAILLFDSIELDDPDLAQSVADEYERSE